MSPPLPLARLVPFVFGVVGLAAAEPVWAGTAPPPRRVEVRLKTTTRRPRIFHVLPGEWVLCSSRRGLWLPYADAGRRELAFQKHGACVYDLADGKEGALLGVRLGTQTGRAELRSALKQGVSPLTIWCVTEQGLQDIPPLEPGRRYSLVASTVGNLESLAKLRHLSGLRFGCAPGVTDLSPLVRLQALESLCIWCRDVTDLGPLGRLPNLRVLYLYAGEGLVDLSPLTKLKKLASLTVSDAWSLTDLSPLAALPSLTTLDLKGARSLTSLAPLARLANLTWLDLHDADGVRDLSPLRGLRHLVHLDLGQCTKVANLSPLTDLVNLEYLDLHGAAGVEDVSPLARMTRLKHIDLLGCREIRSLWPMRHVLQTHPPHVAVEAPLRSQRVIAQSALPSTLTVTTNGQHIASVDPSLDFADAPCRWINILARGVRPPSEFNGTIDRLLYPVAGKRAGEVLRFTWDGPRVWLAENGGPRRLAGIVATQPSGRVALRDAVARKISPLVVWADANSLESLPDLPDDCGVTLVMLGLGVPLKPLAKARNLSGLHILSCGNPVTDLGDLRRLTCLHTLDLPTGPRIKSLARLAAMTHLQALSICLSHGVTDLSPLTGLAQLETLQLQCSSAPNLTRLARLPKLRVLSIAGTANSHPLTGLEALKGIDTLTLQWHGGPGDFAGIAALRELKALHLIDCKRLDSLDIVAGLPKLEVLTLRDCDRVSDLAPVAALPSLRTFRLDFCDGIADLTPLRRLKTRGVRLHLDTHLRRRLAAVGD